MYAYLANAFQNFVIVLIFNENEGNEVFNTFCQLNVALSKKLLYNSLESGLLLWKRLLQNLSFDVFFERNEQLSNLKIGLQWQ
jgi:hypothetical protein